MNVSPRERKKQRNFLFKSFFHNGIFFHHYIGSNESRTSTSKYYLYVYIENARIFLGYRISSEFLEALRISNKERFNQRRKPISGRIRGRLEKRYGGA